MYSELLPYTWPGLGDFAETLVITPTTHKSFTENTPFYVPRNLGSEKGRMCPKSRKPHTTLCKLQSSTHKWDLVPGPRSTSVTVCGTALVFLSLLFSERPSLGTCVDTLIDTALASATQSCRLTPFSLLALEPQRTAPPSYMAVQHELGRLGIGWVDG